MNILDNLSEIKNIDKKNVLGSVKSLPKQFSHAWESASQVKVPNTYRNIKNIVMCGMGGSGLGARVIQSVFSDQIKLPLVRINNYDLPGFVDKNTLVICSSYSGSTEETIENANQAISKKCKWMAIGTGGPLLKLAENHQVPYYQINPVHNPSDQPRMAIGYSVVGQLVFVSKIGIVSLTKKDLNDCITAMHAQIDQSREDVPLINNPAKKLALKMKDKIVLFFSSDHLVGAMHTVNNQTNENVKNISADYEIPELNHHFMEGLKHPASNSKNLFVYLATSDLYSPRIQKRHLITQDVVSQNNIQSHLFKASSSTKLSQAFELIQFGAYLNLYLAMLYKQNPAPIPWVDYFKKKLG